MPWKLLCDARTATTLISRSPGNEPADFTYEVRALNAANVASAWRGTVTLCVGSGGGNIINAPMVITVRYLHTDALGAVGAGLRGVWIDRAGTASPEELAEAAEGGVGVIRSLAELPVLLA